MRVALSLLCVLPTAMLAPALAETPARSLAEAEFRQAMRLPADTAAGRQIFVTCAGCHGKEGAGSSSDFVPRIAGQHYRVIIRQLVDYRHGRRWNAAMQGAAADHELPDAQAIVNVASFINLLKIRGPSNQGTGLAAEEGGHIYDAVCVSCHGPGARGSDEKGIPRLAGQNYGYLVRQFVDIAAGKRPNVPRPHGQLLAKLQYQEIVALSDYLSSIML